MFDNYSTNQSLKFLCDDISWIVLHKEVVLWMLPIEISYSIEHVKYIQVVMVS